MRYYFTLLVLVCYSVFTLTGCKSNDDELAPAADGIVFSPASDYQEAYPGALLNFDYKVRSADPVTSFKVQFMLPGTTVFVDLPQYPEVTQNASAFTATFKNFEYSLPPSATIINALVKFKFIAKTANRTFERIYTVKILSTGFKVLRLYNPVASTYYKATALDLLNGTIVPDNLTTVEYTNTKDMMAVTGLATIGDNGTLFTTLLGWKSVVPSVPLSAPVPTPANQTKFKARVKADFDKDPTTYAASYALAGTELTELNIRSTTAPLTGNQYYLAKIMRTVGTTTTTTYVGIFVRSIPVSRYFTNTGLQDLSGEYLEIQIKK